MFKPTGMDGCPRWSGCDEQAEYSRLRPGRGSQQLRETARKRCSESGYWMNGDVEEGHFSLGVFLMSSGLHFHISALCFSESKSRSISPSCSS